MKHLIYSSGFRWLHFDHDGVGPVIAVVTLRRMATELLGLFSPLYVFGVAQGMGSSFRNSLLAVVGYIFLIYLAKLLTMPLAENLSFRSGYRLTLSLSLPPFILFVIFLALSQNWPALLILVAIFWGIHAALFWFGFHGLFVKRGDHERFGQQTGASQALYILTGVITPILGGLIILNFSFQMLFLFAGAIFTLGVLMMLFSKEIRPRQDARITNVFQLFKTHKRVVAAYFGWGLESSLYGAIWPIFLFLLVGKILSFGQIISAAVLVAAVITYLSGLVVDRVGTKEIISLGSILGFFTWIARIVARAPLAIVGMDGLYRVAEQMLHIPFNVLTYQKALAGGTGQALYFREISICLGAIISMIGAAILIFFNFPLWSVFILASLGSLTPLFSIQKEK